jgi:hypothetical protein
MSSFWDVNQAKAVADGNLVSHPKVRGNARIHLERRLKKSKRRWLWPEKQDLRSDTPSIDIARTQSRTKTKSTCPKYMSAVAQL